MGQEEEEDMEVMIERNGTLGSESVTLGPGEYNFSVYDFDNGTKFGPALTDQSSVTPCNRGN